MSVVKRNSSIDLLRIIAMLMIVCLHCVGHGGVTIDGYGSKAYFWGWMISSFTSVGVNCYVLITGYFLISSSQISVIKVLKIWGSVFAYSIGFFSFFVLWEIPRGLGKCF